MEFKYGSEADGSRVLMNYRLAAASTPVAANLPSPAPVSVPSVSVPSVPVAPALVVPVPVAAPAPSHSVAPPKPIMVGGASDFSGPD